MTIAVTGSTGQLGRLVIAGLKEHGKSNDVIALARTPEKASDLGVTVRQADYDRPETLTEALAGVDTVLLISGSEVGKRLPQHKAVIDAARANGVKRIVYTSLLKADTSPLSLAPEHIETEKLIKASGIEYTILRNGWYFENYTGSLGGALAAGALAGTSGDGRISAASRADYADAAIAVLLDGDHTNATYELAGDSAFTLGELAKEVSDQTGKPFPYNNLPEEDYAAILVSAGLPKEVAAMIASFGSGAAQGALFYEGKELSSLTGRKTTPLSQAVKEALAAQ